VGVRLIALDANSGSIPARSAGHECPVGGTRLPARRDTTARSAESRQASSSRWRQASVSATWLNVNRCSPVTFIDSSARKPADF
jgi:hypothetical protein